MPTRVKSKGIHRIRQPIKRDGAQVDWAVVEKAVSGEQPKLYPREMYASIRILTEQGMNGLEIARTLGCCERTVYRTWKKMRLVNNN